MKVKGYEIILQSLSEEDGGGFVAIVPDLPGCTGDGDSPEEAMANAAEAIASWKAMARKLGHKVPQPHPAHA